MILFQVLDLSDNKIRILSNSSFIYYTSLQILYLSDNRILYIEEGTFLPLTELKTLDLSSNSLRKVPYVLPSSLVKLYLAANPIEEVRISPKFNNPTIFFFLSFSRYLQNKMEYSFYLPYVTTQIFNL